MKATIKILSLLLILIFFFSCDKKDEKAAAYLLKARNLMSEKEYSKARLTIDSIGILYPNAYIQIRWGELLLDSIKREESMIRIDSLNNLKYSYEAKMRDCTDLNAISELKNRIDSIEAQKVVPRNIINDIYDKELKAAARCQCKTILK